MTAFACDPKGRILNQPMPPPADVAARVGVVLYETTQQADALLTAAVDAIRSRGIVVGGLLQRLGPMQSNGKHSVWLDDVATGQTVRLDEPRGPGARACILDTDALAQAAYLLRRAADARPGVIVVNRFGKFEAEGGGIRSELAEAICSGAAVLIPVRLALLPDLEAFLGAPASRLPPDAASIADWAERASPITATHGVGSAAAIPG